MNNNIGACIVSQHFMLLAVVYVCHSHQGSHVVAGSSAEQMRRRGPQA